jgi:enoyl-CoA hydratase/carnithine racemase
MDTLIVEKKHNLLTITINRPEKANAFSLEMLRRMRDMLKELHEDTKSTVVLLKAAGERAFSAGVDSKEILTLPPEKKKEVYDLMVESGKLALTCDKIIIAALNGVILGMGCGLVLAADLRIAVDRPEVYMQMLEVDVGMFPVYVMGLSFYHFPPAVASKLVFGGEKFGLEEMRHHGFLHSVYPPEEFDKGIKRVVRVYTNKRTDMIRQSKQCLCKEREGLLKNIELEHGFGQKFYDSLKV